MPVEIDIEDLDDETRQALIEFARSLTTEPVRAWSIQRVPKRDNVWLPWILVLENGTRIAVASNCLEFIVQKVGANTDLLVRLPLRKSVC